jgi:hypothetical protein
MLLTMYQHTCPSSSSSSSNISSHILVLLPPCTLPAHSAWAYQLAGLGTSLGTALAGGALTGLFIVYINPAKQVRRVINGERDHCAVKEGQPGHVLGGLQHAPGTLCVQHLDKCRSRVYCYAVVHASFAAVVQQDC